jgi:hypothetical protein
MSARQLGEALPPPSPRQGLRHMRRVLTDVIMSPRAA